MRLRTWARVAGPMTILRGFGQASEFVGWLLLARTLGANELGPLTVAFLVARYLGLMADWGAERRGARDVVVAPAIAASLIHQRARLSNVGALLYVAGCAVAGSWWALPFATVVVHGGRNIDWLPLGATQPVRASVTSLVRGASVSLVGVIALDRADAVIGVAVAYLVATLASQLAARELLAALPKQPRSFVDGWALMITALAAVYTVMDAVVIAVIKDTTDAGVYGAVARVPFGFATLAGLGVAAFVPLAARATGGSRDGAAGVARPAGIAAAAIGVVLMIVAIPIAHVAVGLLGDDFEEGFWPLVVLLLAQAVSIASAPLGAVLLSVGGDRSIAKIVAIAAVVNVAGNLAFIPLFGMVAAGWTTLLAEAIVYYLFARSIRQSKLPEVVGA